MNKFTPLLAALSVGAAQAQPANVTTLPETSDDTVEWLTLSGDLSQTRYSRSDQIDASNFADLETAWVWDGASFQLQFAWTSL